MSEIANAMRERLDNDQVAIGLNARYSRTSEFGAILHDCGYHWFFVDAEHSPMPAQSAYEMCLGAIRAGVTPIARVRRNEPAEIGAALSNGAMGILVPHVHTAAAAEQAAIAARYPPVGTLSAPGSIPQFGYRKVPLNEAAERFNGAVTVIAMIESVQAVENVAAIAAVDGVDGLFMGASDLTFDMGIHSQYGHERVTEAVDQVCRAARRHGKFAGIGGVREDADWARYIKLGIRLVLTENDLSLLITRATERAKFCTGLPVV